MCAHELNLSSLYVSDDSEAKTTTKKTFLVLMERHVGRHCGRDFKLPWQRGWPLGWPESTKAPFFLKLFVVHCLAACSRFNLSSRGHSETKKRVSHGNIGRFWCVWPGLRVNNDIGAPKMGKFSLQHGSGSHY